MKRTGILTSINKKMAPVGTADWRRSFSELKSRRAITSAALSARLNVSTATQTINVTVSDSVSANNGDDGIFAGTTGGTVNVMVRNSTVANNGLNGLSARVPISGAATIRVTRSTITGNATGWAVISPGVVLSYGDNNIDGNGAANAEPPSPLVYQ